MFRRIATTLAVAVGGAGGAASFVVAATPAGAAKQSACSNPAAKKSGTVAYRRLPGVPTRLTSLDVHTFAGACDAPVVVWVHGGGYAVGDKANQMTDKVRLAHEQGWVLVSVNYRLTQPGQSWSAQYPDHYDDVAHALQWVHANVAKYGGDPDRIALLGHSAGADIVANVVTNPEYLARVGLQPSDLACFGPLDTEGFDKTAAGQAEQGQWQRALGNSPSYLHDTSGTVIATADAGIPPAIGVVRGAPGRRAIETAFLARLAELGVPTTTIEARGLSHGDVNSRIGAPGDAVMTPPLVSFLDGCFRR